MPVSNPYKRQLLGWVPTFLDAILRGLSVKEACRRAGVVPSVVYHHRKKNEHFRVEWDEAAEIGTLQLEQEAQRRAYHGTGRPVFYKGSQCGTAQEYSDTLLMFLLRARKPETYREKFEPNQVNVNVNTQNVRREAIVTLNQLFADERIPIEQLDPATVACEAGDGGHAGEVAAGPPPEGDKHDAHADLADPE